MEEFSIGNWETIVDRYCANTGDAEDHLRGAIGLLQTMAPIESVKAALLRAGDCGASDLDIESSIGQAARINVACSMALIGEVESAVMFLESDLGEFDARLQLGHALLKAGEWIIGDRLIKEALKINHLQLDDAVVEGHSLLAEIIEASKSEARTNAGADKEAIESLLSQAATWCFDDLPRQVLVESRSLPRCGHHYLKRTFQSCYGEDFSYCENYQEPGCCKRQPCAVNAFWSYARSKGKPHLRLTKSHDFDLEDPIYETLPGVIRFVQVRRPLPFLASWLELEQLAINRKLLTDNGISLDRIYLYHEVQLLSEAWRLIDLLGEVMSQEQAQAWLEKKKDYVVGFLGKWLPICQPLSLDKAPISGSFLLWYEDLGLASQILMNLLGNNVAVADPVLFSPKVGDPLKRPSNRVASLLQIVESSIVCAESDIFAACPDFQRQCMEKQ